MFAISFGVYNATLAPGLTFVSLDGNELATDPYRLGLAHSPGYPFFTWMGKLFTLMPFGDVAHCMNLMSALSAAGACVLLYAIARLLTRSRPAALLVAILFAVSPTFWSQAVITEVYAANSFMLALTLFLFLSWGDRLRRQMAAVQEDRTSRLLFWGGCLVFGLSLGTHLSNLALAPALALYIYLFHRGRTLRWQPLLVGGGLFALAACQFLWLYFRASTLNDELMLSYKPDSLKGVYDYMFNVFHADRFGFPLSALPDRFSIYGGLVKDNFGVLGSGIALIGIWQMFRQQRRAFCLLAVTYLIELAYFTQYNVPDVDAFFIPAHMIFAVFVAFGLRWLLVKARDLTLRFRPARPALSLSLCLVVALPLLLQVPDTWSQNDHSGDTSVKDFYRHVFQALPHDSVILGHRGVPGFDLFHYYLVNGSRPDVSVPQLASPYVSPADVGDRPLFLTISPDLLRFASEDGEDKDTLPSDLWYVPVMAAPSPFVSWLGGHPLTLYEARTQPPPLFADDPHPQHIVGKEMNGVRLLGFDLDDTQVTAGGALHLRLYWQPVVPPALSYYKVSLVLGDDRYRETHTLGFGLLERYQRDQQLPAGATIVEDYQLIVMSSLSAGQHELRLMTSDFGALGTRTEESVDLAEIEVTK